jgi:hypothetical protein
MQMPEVKLKIDICATCPWLCPPPGANPGGPVPPPGPPPPPGVPGDFNVLISLSQSDIQELQQLSARIAEDQDLTGQSRLEAARLILDNNRFDIAKVVVDQVIIDIANSDTLASSDSVGNAFKLRSEIQRDFSDPVQAYIDSYVARRLQG